MAERIKKLNEKHKKFAQEYLKDFNATRAYKAVYSTKNDKTAATNGGKLLRNAEVQRYLSEVIHQTKLKDIMQIDEVLAKISEIARGKPRDKVFKRTSYDHKNGKTEIEFDTVTTSQPEDEDQLKALELMGRYYKLFLELSNPELDKAKLRKAKADARIKEAEAKISEEQAKSLTEIETEENGNTLLNAIKEGLEEVWDEDEDTEA